ncbi:hypothetical protein INP51_05490 [Blautia liquoris]|jgi:hypothetical protein|uniref:Uncharacterized protein n=1 Tax=Blautia liquoris TaxID=2779518 RepID=A0A7M2RM30_9FIRM|nr:hypothetical protein [Blautia liquoris]QOV20400.1 hypothetical protein INP51_05490 [Blautia liquoris]
MSNCGNNRGYGPAYSRGSGCTCGYDEIARMEAALANAVRSLENTECAADQIRCALKDIDNSICDNRAAVKDIQEALCQLKCRL